MQNTYSIYMHKNKINNKVYIGQTSLDPPEKRWRNGAGYSNQMFYKAIKKYGWDNFEHIILCSNLSFQEANTLEKYYINLYKSNLSQFGYNCTDGGQNSSKLSLESIQKIKDSWTPEKRKEQSKKLKDKWKNDKDFRRKATALNPNQWHPKGELNPMYGTHRTGKEAARKRKVQCVETGEIFDTVKQAAEWANNGKDTIKSHISAVCKGKRQTSGKHPITKEPLHWRYVDEKEPDATVTINYGE